MSALLTDLYQLTMLQAYLEEDMTAPAVFELFVRKLPAQRNFLVAAGLEQVLQYLETFSFSDAEIAWLQTQGGFSSKLLRHLSTLRFEGDVDAMPEGTIFFADEPIIRITAPLPQAQLVESRLLNLAHFETLIASKAARVMLAAGGRRLVDFGMRRAHGAEAATLAARAAYLAGFDGTATAEAGRLFGIPVFGTMAHSFVQAHASERAAFDAFARARPQRPTLLVDTYDTEAAVAKVIEAAPSLARDGIAIGGVRIDSGDLCAHAKAVRRLLDAAALQGVTIFASGNLDEHRIASLLADGAPIDGFGVGTALDTSSDAPALDAVYKLQSYAGVARRKRSEGKATWPGIKQVVRRLGGDGGIERDVVQLDGEPRDGEALLRPCMRGGRRVGTVPTLDQSRAYHARQMAALPAGLRTLLPTPQPFLADISAALRALAREVDTETADPLPDTEAKLRYLESTLAPARTGEPVRRLETHMSWLLLGGDQVLKLKKPVRYPFLDFSTVQAREHDGREELRLNRRLAPRVYLGLRALTWDDGVFSLLPEDRLPEGCHVVDWLVAMQRLPAARMLDQVIARKELRPRDVDALLDVLVPFYRSASRPAIGEDAYLERLRGEQAANRSVLALPRFGLPQIETTLDRMDRSFAQHESMLRARVREGRIVEGHGDLRPEHVCLVEPPVVIDALEFDAGLRELDPFDELCFLGLECAMAGDAAIGPHLVARCAEALDDHPAAALLSLHTARRALLRARLSVAHLLDANVRTPQKWLPQASRYLQHARAALDGLD